MRTKHITTYSQAKYVVTEDGSVNRERGNTDIHWTFGGFQYDEGQLLTPFDLIKEGERFQWYGTLEFDNNEGHAEIISTSAVVDVTVEDTNEGKG